MEGDSQEYDLDEPAVWHDTSIEDVHVLDLTVLSPFESAHATYTVLFDYFDLMENSIQRKDEAVIQDVMNEYENIHGSLNQFFPNETALLDTALKESGLASNAADGSANPDFFPQVITLLSQLKTILKDRIRELSEPTRELLTAAQLLKTTISEISDVSVLLQTGQDKQAMSVVIAFSELSQKITRLYPILANSRSLNFSELTVGSVSFEEFYLSLNEIMRELTEAFEAKDSVLIGDLLEYEIAPRLEKLIQVLEQAGSGEDR
jgi:hypothetical protein